jgi:(5-formylfuran-3-yl)methyl phosphate synthase
MTQLLVSVRDPAEARRALAAGAALIDVKEPARGALAAAEPSAIAAVIAEVAGRVPVSAALGELADNPPVDNLLLPGLSFAKLGLAGCGRWADWPAHWEAALARFPGSIAAVAVAYADWRDANAPSPADVLRHASRLGCRAALVDTFDKSGGGLFDRWSLAEVERFVSAAHEARLLVVLGGSLDQKSIPAAAALRPDYIAVRGAACRGSRHGPIDEQNVRRLIAEVARLRTCS